MAGTAIIQIVTIFVHLRYRLSLHIHEQNAIVVVNRTGVIFNIAKIHTNLPLVTRDSLTRASGLTYDSQVERALYRSRTPHALPRNIISRCQNLEFPWDDHPWLSQTGSLHVGPFTTMGRRRGLFPKSACLVLPL